MPTHRKETIKTYDETSDLPDDVIAFKDDVGLIAVRVGYTGDSRCERGYWWWIGTASAPLTEHVEDYRNGEARGHEATSAHSPLTPIDWPDFMQCEPPSLRTSETEAKSDPAEESTVDGEESAT